MKCILLIINGIFNFWFCASSLGQSRQALATALITITDFETQTQSQLIHVAQVII